jgi:non-heme chloroperoxidase
MLGCLSPRRVLVVEVRGRGRSEAPVSGYAAADHVADLTAVLQEEAIGRFHLMTFSRGTSWGLPLALGNPSRVASIAIGDYKAWEMQLPPTFADRQMATRFRGLPMSERMQRHVLDGLVMDSHGTEFWDRLAELPGPLLVAQPGSGKGVVTEEVVARYRAVRPDVEVVVVPDAPHDLFRPDRLFYPRAVEDFIARRCPGL